MIDGPNLLIVARREKNYRWVVCLGRWMEEEEVQSTGEGDFVTVCGILVFYECKLLGDL